MKPVLVMTDKSGAMGATVASLPHMGGHGGHDGRPWATLYPPPGPVHIFAPFLCFHVCSHSFQEYAVTNVNK